VLPGRLRAGGVMSWRATVICTLVQVTATFAVRFCHDNSACDAFDLEPLYFHYCAPAGLCAVQFLTPDPWMLFSLLRFAVATRASESYRWAAERAYWAAVSEESPGI